MYLINIKYIKRIILLAMPIIISNLSRVFMELADMTMIAGYKIPGDEKGSEILAENSIAAIGFSAMLVWIIISMGISLRTSTQTITSRRFGEKEYSGCGQALQHGQLLSLIFGLPITLLLYLYIPTILNLLISQKSILPLTIDYSLFMVLSIYFVYGSFVFQGFYNGVKMTRTHMKVMIMANLMNVYLNAGLIYGSDNVIIFLENYNLGFLSFLWNIIDFPEMHVKGAGLATMLASIVMFVLYFMYLFQPDLKDKYHYFRLQLNKLVLKNHFVLTAPMYLQELLASSGYFIFFKIIELGGKIPLGATSVIFRIAHASFMPGIGIGQAASTLIGNYLGERKIDKAREIIVQSIYIVVFAMGTMGTLFIIFPSEIMSIFNIPAKYYEYSVPGLQYVGLLQFFDAFGITLWFALTAAGDVKFPAMADVLIIWLIFLPISYILATRFEMYFWGPWIAFGLHIILFAIVVMFRIRSNKWTEIKV